MLADDNTIGEDIEVGVKVTNTAKEERKIKVRLTLASTFYTGVTGKKVKGEMTELSIGAGEGI